MLVRMTLAAVVTMGMAAGAFLLLKTDSYSVLNAVGYFLNFFNYFIIFVMIKIQRFCREYEADFLKTLGVRYRFFNFSRAACAVKPVHNKFVFHNYLLTINYPLSTINRQLIQVRGQVPSRLFF